MNRLIPWKRSELPTNGARELAPVTALRHDWDRLFDRLLDDAWGGTGQAMPLDVTETDEEIRVRAEVPGIAPEELEISLSGDVLTLCGEKHDDAPAREARQAWSERQFGTWRRALRLSCPVDADSVKAEHKNGVVTITLQKAEAVRPKRIRVKPA
jgi:HSP20 family protein